MRCKLIKKQMAFYLYLENKKICTIPFVDCVKKEICLNGGELVNISLFNCLEIEEKQPNQNEWDVYIVDTRESFPTNEEEENESFGFFKNQGFNLIDLERKAYFAPSYYFNYFGGYAMRSDTEWEKRIKSFNSLKH